MNRQVNRLLEDVRNHLGANVFQWTGLGCDVCGFGTVEDCDKFRPTEPCPECGAVMVEQDVQAEARRNPEAVLRRKVIMAIYKRMPTGNKMLRNKKHIVMWTGEWAKKFGVESYTNTPLEDLSHEDLVRAAKAVGVD